MTTKYMPEVGTECEYTHGEWGEWVKIVVKAASGDEFWVKDEYGDAIVSINEHTFRPLKTQDDIEREDSVQAIQDDNPNVHPCITDFGVLYDAGHRLAGDEATKDEINKCLRTHIAFSDNLCLILSEGLNEHFKIYPRGE